jgi:hypothetical protein
MDRFEELVTLSSDRPTFGKALHDAPFVDFETIGQPEEAI